MPRDGTPAPPPLTLAFHGFEGTFDELLSQVRCGSVSVASLPLAQITSSVLGWVRQLQSQRKIDSGEVVEVVAALIRIKSRSLLPACALEPPSPTAGGAESPGALEDLETLRGAIQHLRELWKPVRRPTLEGFLFQEDPPEPEPPHHDTLFDLIHTLEQALSMTRKAPPPLCCDREIYPLRELVELILASCTAAHAEDRPFVLNELLMARLPAAPGLFLAALELARTRQVTLIQTEALGEIQLLAPAPG